MDVTETKDFKECLRRIEEAKQNQSQYLYLSDLDITFIPKEIEQLTWLKIINLYFSQCLKDISSLASLWELCTINFIFCKSLEDISPLSELISLKTLNLSHSNISDVSALSSLENLTSLDLSHSNISDVSALSSLENLTSLDLSNSNISDVSALSSLENLTSLNLSGDINLSDVSPLSSLKNLTSLDLSFCSLSDVSPLSSLENLTSLDLSDCGNLSDLLPLSILENLTSLDLLISNISDVSPLSSLENLTSLDLSHRNISDVSPLSSLNNLTSLDLSMCSNISDVSPLSSLKNLTSLNLYGTPAYVNLVPSKKPLASLSRLNKFVCNHIESMPSEMASQSESDNILPTIKHWQQDLLQGEASHSFNRVVVIGNGRIGKTQLCRRLTGQPYDETVASTHGIDIVECKIAEAEGEQPEVQARLWDFGGQDIYLGTHSLFLDDRAIYVIAWCPSHENTDEYEDNGIVMRNRPLSYWLEYVYQAAGKSAPVIVVQTQCEKVSEKEEPTLSSQVHFDQIEYISSSSKAPGGLRKLQNRLEEAANYQYERFGKVRLPKSWVIAAHNVLDSKESKTLSYERYIEICKEEGVSAAQTLLTYLHRSGQVYWNQQFFKGDIVVDLSWAFDGIYGLYHREATVPYILKRQGRFTLSDLANMVWRGYSEEEHNVFLNIMKQCGLCFPLNGENTKENEQESLYVAPDHLPSQVDIKSDIQQRWRDNLDIQVDVELYFDFLHEGVARQLISFIGAEIGKAGLYWKYGCCFYEPKHQCDVKINVELPDLTSETQQGSFRFKATGREAKSYIETLLKKIEFKIRMKPKAIGWHKGGKQSDESRQILVESKNDVHYYNDLFEIISREHSFPITLNFVPGSVAKGSNSADVKGMTRHLHEQGNQQIYGLIDWDLKNNPEDKLVVLGMQRRYAIENYIFEPHFLGLYLISKRIAKPSGLGLENCHSYREVCDEVLRKPQLLQKIVDVVESEITESGYWNSNEKPIKFESKLLNGSILNVRDEIRRTNGHELEKICISVWDGLKGIAKNNQGKKGDSVLKTDIINTVINDLPELISIDLLETMQQFK